MESIKKYVENFKKSKKIDARYGMRVEELFSVAKEVENDFFHALVSLFESQEGTFPDACIATNFSLNENGDIM